jgi:predicted nucleic acid-binding protein
MVVAIYRLLQLTEMEYITQYPLDEQRRDRTLSVVARYNLLGADAVYCSLAEELGVGVLSTDGDFRRYTTAIVL